MTKLFTATAIMQPIEDGRCRLDDPVTKYLPDFKTASPGAPADITIRQLLDHTSGMKNLGPAICLAGSTISTIRRRRRGVAGPRRMQAYQKLGRAGGAYSNAGYILLGAVSRRSGVPFEDFVRTASSGRSP